MLQNPSYIKNRPPVIMNYSQTLEYLYSQLPMFQRIGAAAYKADLTNTVALCELLGNPERTFRSVHIAGTNGKGSVSHLAASILQKSGYKTGLYTSPHLKDFRERIRINGKMVPKSFVSGFVNRHKKDFEPIQPSFFEYTVIMAFEYFAREQVDIAILETGMGGRLDSTNVVTPLLSVITNISLDHTTFLGNSLQEIAKEKAGIIKPSVPVVIGETQPEIADIFNEKAQSMDAHIRYADRTYKAARTFTGSGKSMRDRWNILKDDSILHEGIKCPLMGNYQEKNIVTTFGILETLHGQGLTTTPASIRAGMEGVIRNTGLLGRWQVLGANPRTICDVGHNEQGIRNVLEQLKEEPYKDLHIVFGMVNDKDATKILSMLPVSANYYFCKPDIPRGRDAGELKRQAEGAGLKGNSYNSVKEAYQAARAHAHPNDLIFIGGSTFVVAEIL